MENATTRKTTDGVIFETGGYQPFYNQHIKNYKIAFKASAGFRFIYRYLDSDNFLCVRTEGSDVYMEEMRQGEERLIAQDTVEGEEADLWTMTSNEGYVSVSRAGRSMVLPYTHIMKGGVGIEAEAGTTITNIEVVEMLPGFEYEGKGVAYAEGGEVTLSGGRKMGKTLTLTGMHTLTAEYEGTGFLQIGGTMKPIEGKGITSLSVECLGETEFWVGSNEDSELRVEGIQVESGEYGNIILGTGETLEQSELSFPTKNNLYESGSILLSLELATTSKVEVFRCADMVVELNGGRAYFRAGGQIASTGIVEGRDVIVLASYDESGLEVTLTTENGESTGRFDGEVTVTLAPEMWLSSESFPLVGAFKEIVLWKRRLDTSTLSVTTEPMARSFQSDFNDTISSKEKSFVEGTLAPVDGSPLLVEDEEGALNRVNFFDFETAEYRTYNEEYIVYDGVSDFVVVSYDGLDEENFKVQVYDGDVLIGEAKGVSGRKIDLELTDEEKRRLLGKELMVRYQVERSYVVDYQRAALDSYRIYLTKHQGLELSVTQEGDRNGRFRLSKEVELNPMQNIQSEGFLYVSDKEQVVKGLRVFVTPTALVADGSSTATVVVEPIDDEGNEVVGASLLLRTDRGVIEPIVSERQAKARVTGGRYMYLYHAPYYKDGGDGRSRYADIEVLDRKSGIGQKVRLPLKPTSRELRAAEVIVEEDTQVVFEYMSKCFKRMDAPSEWVEILDQNGDGRIDQEEVEWLRKNKASLSVRQMAARLKESEGAQ